MSNLVRLNSHLRSDRRAEDLRIITADTEYGRRWRERFFSKTIPEPNTGCLLWLGAVLHPHNYGVATVFRRRVAAHRVAYAMRWGDCPRDMDLLHSCDQDGCVEWSHLRPGTQAENVADMVRRGRLVPPPMRVAS